MLREVWLPVKGFEGIYEISNKGRLKSFKRNKAGKILSLTNKTGWYFNYVLQYKNKWKSIKIHRLVAEHFLYNSEPNKKTQVNHKDLNKQNNCVENLEWVSPSENIKHAIKHKPEIVSGMNNYNKTIRPKEIVQLTLVGKKIGNFKNSKEAERHTGVCSRNILQVANKTEYKPGKYRKQAGGYIWKFKEDICSL